MSNQRFLKENRIDISKHLAVISKCLAIVLVKNSDNNHNNEENNETVVDSTDGSVNQASDVRRSVLLSSGYNGKELLESFKIINKTCYWNPVLVESVKRLQYKGFVEPSTVLVTGRDIHLENLRSAWGRRVLKAPEGFFIERIGDVNDIQMQIIPQTQFMPLPDALCSIVMDLNVSRVVATLDGVLEKLSLWYTDINMPSQKLVIDTFAALIKERKVFHTGSGYFVVTPDTSRLQTSINTSYHPTNASWLPYHPVYVPIFQGEMHLLSSKSHMRSISCQVTTIEETSEEEDNTDRRKDKDGDENACKVRPSARPGNVYHFSGRDDVKNSKKGKVNTEHAWDGEFKQPSLPSVKGEKMKGAKAVNMKTGKEKGEKTSLFAKIFSRKKKDKNKSQMPPPPPLLQPPSSSLVLASAMTSTSGINGTFSPNAMSEGKGEKEYATFSAQFPPPEWVWYQQQLEKHQQTDTLVTQITTLNVTPGSEITARLPKGRTSRKTNNNFKHFPRASTNNLNEHHGDYVPMSAVSGLEDKCADSKVLGKNCDHDFLKPLPVKPLPVKPESFSYASSVRHHHLQQDGNRKQPQRFSEYNVVDPSDMSLNSSNVYQSILTLSPVANPQDRSTHTKPQQPQLGPYNSTPVYRRPHDRTTYRVDGHEARDRIYGPSNQNQRSHRSRGLQDFSYYNSQGSDISYEYNGCLPKKNSSQSKSRDSGVNCVGFEMPSDQIQKGTYPVYENTTSRRHERHQSRHCEKQHSASFKHPSVHFEGNQTAESTNLNLLSSLDCATPSISCQSNDTNLAYNSVVYGSSTDVTDRSSVVCQTVTSSYMESSEIPFIHNSLQSGYYEDSNFGLASSNAASGQIIAKRSQGLVERDNSSPDTVIVDVVGSPSEIELEGFDLFNGILKPAFEKSARKATVSVEGNAKIVNLRFENHKGDIAEVCNENDDSCEDDCFDCHRGLANEQKDGGITATTFLKMSNSDKVVLAQPSDVPIQRMQDANEGKNKFVTDSGFSSPMNAAEAAGESAGNSDQSNTTSENSGGADDQRSNNSPQNHHHMVSNNSPLPSSNNSSNHIGGSESVDLPHQSKSSHYNGNLCSGASLQQQDCEQITLQKSTSSNQQGSSSNSLLSSSHFQQSQPPHQHNQQLHQNFVQHNHPTAKRLHHHVIYDNSTSDIHKDYTLPARVPLHANAVVNVCRLHRTDKQNNDRSSSVNSRRSNMPNDFTNCEGKNVHVSQNNGLREEFQVMGVL